MGSLLQRASACSVELSRTAPLLPVFTNGVGERRADVFSSAPQTNCFEQSAQVARHAPVEIERFRVSLASEGELSFQPLQLDSQHASASDNAALGGTGIGHVRQVLREDIFGTPCPSTAAINAGSNTLPLPTRLFCGSFAGRSGGEARAMCFINRTTRRRVPLVVLALEPNTYIETPSACKPCPAMADLLD